MIQVFKSVKTQPPSQAQGALPAGPVWQGRDSLAPHRYVGLHGAASRARVPSALSQLIPISSQLTWPNPGTSRMGSGCSPGPGSVWQALAPSHLLLPTPRTHFPSLAALGPLHPQPCWWVMEHPHQHLQVLNVPLLWGCVPSVPHRAHPAGRDASTLALSTVM